MKDEFVTAILREMMPVLDQKQMDRLKTVVRVQLCGYDISKKETGLMRIDQNGPNYLKKSKQQPIFFLCSIIISLIY